MAIALALGIPAMADESGVLPDIPRGRGEQCVEPTPIMRRDHMEFLRHQRDATVHLGIRTERHSLRGCIGCHARRDERGAPIPVNAPGEFCDSCHRFVGASLDCFGCHASTPADDGAVGIARESRR